MADIFREIDEDMRRESAERLWHKYGVYVAAAALVLILATGGWVGWREWHSARLGADGLVLAQAAEAARSGQIEQAMSELQGLAADGAGHYPLLARLRLAALQAESGDAAAAIETYRSIVENPDARPPYRDLAVVMLAMHSLDDGDPNELIGRLEPLVQSSPLRFTALELTALLHHRTGDDAKALEVLKTLSDAGPMVPGPMRDRVQRLQRIFGGETEGSVAG